MRSVQGCLPYAGLALAGALVWPFFAGAVLIKLGLAVWILGFGMVALAKFRLGLESRGRYDLKSLQRVHEQAELKAAEVPAVSADADEVYCMNCSNIFHSRMPICPHCKRPQ